MPQTINALVVDDSTLSRLLIKILLPAYYHIVETPNGKEALALYRESRPDIMFLDLMLPGMNGEDVLASIRKFDPNPNVIVVSSNIQRPVKERLAKMGTLAFIEKPVNQPEAALAIQKVLELVEARQHPLSMSATQQETLAEVLNIGMGRAAKMLSELINDEIELQIPEVGLFPVKEIKDKLENLLIGPITSIHQVFSGPFSGDGLMIVCLQKVLDKSGIKIREGFRFQIFLSGRLRNL